MRIIIAATCYVYNVFHWWCVMCFCWLYLWKWRFFLWNGNTTYMSEVMVLLVVLDFWTKLCVCAQVVNEYKIVTSCECVDVLPPFRY